MISVVMNSMRSGSNMLTGWMMSGKKAGVGARDWFYRTGCYVKLFPYTFVGHDFAKVGTYVQAAIYCSGLDLEREVEPRLEELCEAYWGRDLRR